MRTLIILYSWIAFITYQNISLYFYKQSYELVIFRNQNVIPVFI